MSQPNLKLAQNGQMLHDNCWTISLIASLLFTFISHIRQSRLLGHLARSVARVGQGGRRSLP